MREFFKESERPYVAIADFKGHFVEFTVYEGNNYDASLDPLFAGSVKWDGCSNWEIGELHFCTQKQAKEFGILLGMLYDWAAELMPENKDNLGENKIE